MLPGTSIPGGIPPVPGGLVGHASLSSRGADMIRFAGRGILLDIEGTTASVRFVREELTAYARQQLYTFLRMRWNDPEVREARDLIARDAGAESFLTFGGGPHVPPEYMFRKLREHVSHLMTTDAKSAGLRQLQGLIWRDGFQRGELRSHLYDDVPLALDAWVAAGRAVRIYSSGSMLAQQLYFKHSRFGDLSKQLGGYYDLTLGPKQEPASYQAIAADWQLPPGEILFVGDEVAELDAARTAGLATALAVRPEGHASEDRTHDHPVLTSLLEIELN